jgi:hypothetical protein
VVGVVLLPVGEVPDVARALGMRRGGARGNICGGVEGVNSDEGGDIAACRSDDL